MKKFNQTSKKLLIFLFVILLVQGVFGAGLVDRTLLENKDSTSFDFYNSIDQFAMQNHLSINVRIEGDGTKIFEILDKNGEIIRTDKIPLGYELEYKDENFIISGSSNKKIDILGLGIKSQGIIEIKISSQKETKKIELTRGTADIKVGDYPVLKGIRNAEIRVKSKFKVTADGKSYLIPKTTEDSALARLVRRGAEIEEVEEITYARFNSEKGGVYDFEYQGKVYHFYANENSDILFDPENPKGGVIKGDGADLTYISPGIGLENYKIKGKYSLKLDKDGKPIRIDIEDGIFNGEHFGEYHSKNKKLTIFLDGSNVRDFDGDVISIDFDKRKIGIKGQVIGNNLKRVHYEGISDDAYTEYYHDGKEGDPSYNPYFDVIQGEANIDNGKHLINVKDGKSKLRIRPGIKEGALNFRVSSHEEGREIGIFVDEKAELFYVTAYDSTGKAMGKAAEISLKSLNERLSIPTSDIKYIVERGEEILEGKIRIAEEQIKLGKELASKGELSKEDKNELNAAILGKAILENRLDKLRAKPLEDSIKRMKNLDIDDLSMKIESKNILAGLYAEKASQNAIYIKDLNRGTIEVGKKLLGIPDDNGIYTYVALGATKLYYKFNKKTGNWQWSPDRVVWMSTSTTYVYNPGGRYHKEQPALGNIKIINQLNHNVNNNEDFLKFLESRKILESDVNSAIRLYEETENFYKQEYRTTREGRFSDQAEQIRFNRLRTKFIKEGEDLELFREFTYSQNHVVRAEAKRMFALSDFSKNPGKNAKGSLSGLLTATKLDSNNQAAIDNLRMQRLHLLNGRASILKSEVDKAVSEKKNVLGEGGFSQYTFSAFQTISQGLRENIFGAYGVTETRQAAIERKVEISAKRLMGVNELRNLIQNDVNMENYMEPKNYLENLITTMQVKGRDNYISSDELEGYASGMKIYPNSKELMGEFIEGLRSHLAETKGSIVANRAVNDVMDSAVSIRLTQNAIMVDPAIYYIATGGKDYERGTNIEFRGAMDIGTDKRRALLDNAFTSGRMGESIERTWYEATLTTAGDFLLTSLVVAGGAGALTKTAAQVGGKVEKGFRIGRSILAPTETFFARTLGQTAPKTAALLGLGGEVGSGIGISYGLYAVDPRLAAAYDTISMFGGHNAAGKFKGKVKISKANGQLFAHVDENMAGFIKQFEGDNIIIGGQKIRIATPPKGAVTTSLDDLAKSTVDSIQGAARSADNNLAGMRRRPSLPTEIELSQARRRMLHAEDLNLAEVGGLSDANRLVYAERRLGDLTNTQRKQILDAHYTEVGKGIKRISRKAEILTDFTPQQRRVLMENGITGDFSQIKFRTSAELKNIDFADKVYVRFENVRQANWPTRGETGNLPFISEMVNPKRGPRFSVFTEDQLTKAGFFKMNPKQKGLYLARFGIRTDLSNRKMIKFKLEDGIKLEFYQGKFSRYTNIIVEDTVPAVKVLERKKIKL